MSTVRSNFTVRGVVAVAVAVVAVSTFILLYFGLVELARMADMDPYQTWLYPLAIDGLTLAAYVATLRLTGKALAYAWSVVAVGSLMSFAGQWLHASEGSDWAWAAPVASLPALSLALAWHLLWLVLNQNIEERQVETAQAQAEQAVVESAVDAIEDEHVVVIEEAVSILQKARTAGRKLTGTDMANLLGLPNAETLSGKRTGQRWLRRAELHLDDVTTDSSEAVASA